MRVSKTLGLTATLLLLLPLDYRAHNGSAHVTRSSQGTSPDKRRIEHWLDFDIDERKPMGSAQNPAVILPADLIPLLGKIYKSVPAGQVVFVPASEIQRVTGRPDAADTLKPIFNQITNVKSFNDFSAVDTTGLLKGLPSEFYESHPKGRTSAEEDAEATAKGLENGDLVFGSHLAGQLTWGNYSHVAIVVDAAKGILVESIADAPAETPGVRSTDWKNFADKYVHVGVARVKGLTPDQSSKVVKWVEEQKGKPFRWPITAGMDRNDDGRFYSSQLVWLAYQRVLNIDLDSDQGLLVFPDDIYLCRKYLEIVVP